MNYLKDIHILRVLTCFWGACFCSTGSELPAWMRLLESYFVGSKFCPPFSFFSDGFVLSKCLILSPRAKMWKYFKPHYKFLPSPIFPAQWQHHANMRADKCEALQEKMKCKQISAEKTLGCLFLGKTRWWRGVCLCETERAVILFISSAPALWFLWGTDVHNSIQSHPLNSLSVPAPPTACTAPSHTRSPHVNAPATLTCILWTFDCPSPSAAQSCISCSWVNTWFNQVWLPPWSVCTAVSQMCSELLATKHLDFYCFPSVHLLMSVNGILLLCSWIHIPD